MMKHLEEEGLKFETNLEFKSIEPLIYTERDDGGNGAKVRATRSQGGELVFTGDAVLVSVGRAPNVENIGLEKAGVVFDARKGVQVDEFLRTSNPDILAVGDVCSADKFTHVSGTQAQMAVENALFGGQMSSAELLVPHVTYCEPEVATVGLTEAQADAQGVKVAVYRSSFEHNDRAILDGKASGFCKILVKEGSDEIVGATIVAHSAGELISEVTMAIRFGIGLGFEDGIGSMIHSYPTMAEGVAGCAFGFKLKHWKMLQADGQVKAKAYRRASASSQQKRGAVGYGELLGGCAIFALAGFALGLAVTKK
jgi:pyruvate/2-oxoglutarate dehydrogenase complex dihydrolipoamide dehydrogenase (E3) component